MARSDGRKADELRPVSIATGYLPWAEGSVMIDLGGTQVLCAATIEAGVPRFLRGSGAGWVTAEYSMLPRSTKERTGREVAAGRPSGRCPYAGGGGGCGRELIAGENCVLLLHGN